MWAEGASYKDVTSRPDPVAEGDKLKVPRSGDFVRQSPGVQGEEAIVLPLRAPCASGNMWLSS